MDKILESIERSFALSTSEMRRIIRDFHSEMEKGLSGKPSSLKMIPTYVDRPTGSEKGSFLALDLGGTNFRILELELKGDGRIGAPKIMKFALGKSYIKGAGKDFFDFLAKCLKTFLNKHNVGDEETRDLGFTFSFPVKQTGVANGTLVCWTKGFAVRGVVGKDVVKLFEEALERNSVGSIKITALANDTVGALVAKSYEEPDCDVGVILGTGTNACYPEKISNITKWNSLWTRSGRMIINTEWGNFNKLPLTIYDKALDKLSTNPGEQVLEKMVSGMYLGEVARLIIKDLIEQKRLFGKRRSPIFEESYSLRAEHLSEIEKDNSPGLAKVKIVLRKLGVSGSTRDDRMLVRKVCGLVSTRAARISAAAIAAIVTRMDPHLSRAHTIAIDGSVFEKHPGFSNHMNKALKELFAKKAYRIKTKLAKDASGKGAAVIAAVA